MLHLEGGCKAFRGAMRVTPGNPSFPARDLVGDWLYRPGEGGYWYCNGQSFPDGICKILRDDTVPKEARL